MLSTVIEIKPNLIQKLKELSILSIKMSQQISKLKAPKGIIYRARILILSLWSTDDTVYLLETRFTDCSFKYLYYHLPYHGCLNQLKLL